jgi:hypothetical protein
MSYNSTTDFLALVREAGGEASIARIPGLDYILAAMARAGMFRLHTGQDEPTTNQEETVWLRPASPSWTAEGSVLLWDGDAFVNATPELWAAVLIPTSPVFQSVTTNSANVGVSTSLLAIERATPAGTVLFLPSVVDRLAQPLQIVDWSSDVVEHAITLRPRAGQTIMRNATFSLYSTAAQLAGIGLMPSTDLNGWVIAP